jgi:hypothetical protein
MFSLNEILDFDNICYVCFIYLGGDFLKGDGTGSFSIYGDKFPVSSQHFPFSY